MATRPKMFLVERDGAIVTWKYYNPPQNLLNPNMHAEFGGLVRDFYEDPELRVGIFATAIPGVFIQHYDVADLVEKGTALTKKPADEKPAGLPPRRINFHEGSKPIIAAINAPVAGGGLELAMGMVVPIDFRFMSRSATVAQPEVGVGILAGGGGTQRMPRLIGIARSLELQLTGRRVYADEAERIGLVTRACDPERLMPEALAFARELAMRPPLAVHHIRRAIYEGMSMSLDDGLALESELMRELMQSDEALERMRAYVAGGQNSRRIVEEESSS
jgi:enoyl-CoA hydratase